MTTLKDDKALLPADCICCGQKAKFSLGKRTSCQLHGEPMQRVVISCTNRDCPVDGVSGGDIFNGGEAKAREEVTRLWNKYHARAPSLTAPDGVMSEFNKGDYVLATKYSDGDPNDHWCVGLYDRYEDGRHHVVDTEGKEFRLNGLQRCQHVSDKYGEFLLRNIETIEKYAGSLWDSEKSITSLAHAAAEKKVLLEALKLANSAINASYALADAEIKGHDKATERYSAIIRSFCEKADAVIAQIEGK